jgi:hypothetical protein
VISESTSFLIIAATLKARCRNLDGKCGVALNKMQSFVLALLGFRCIGDKSIPMLNDVHRLEPECSPIDRQYLFGVLTFPSMEVFALRFRVMFHGSH